MTSVVTRSGVVLDLVDPDPASILRGDVLAGLSGSCRFAGQTDVFYSVAQHSVMVADLVEALVDESGESDGVPRGATLIGALHHDSHEAFISDLPAPLKSLIPEYESIAGRLDRAIIDAIGIRESVWDSDSWDLIHRADMTARCIEAITVMPGAAEIVLETTEGVTSDDIELARALWMEPRHPEGARDLFAEREDAFYRLLSEEVGLAAGEPEQDSLRDQLHVLRYPLDWFSQPVRGEA